MYTDDEIEQLKEKLEIVQNEKECAENQNVFNELQAMEKEYSATLISKYYRMVNYSHFNTEALIESIADLISIVEKKKMVPDIIYASRKLGYHNLNIHYAILIIHEKEMTVPAYFHNFEQLREYAKDKNILILQEAVGSIPKEMNLFELIHDSLFITKDNMNLINIKGIRCAIDLDQREYLSGYIQELLKYKYDHYQMEIDPLGFEKVKKDYAQKVLKQKKIKSKRNEKR